MTNFRYEKLLRSEYKEKPRDGAAGQKQKTSRSEASIDTPLRFLLGSPVLG